MINDDELRAALADRERNAPDVDAVRREISGRNQPLGRWSGRGPVLLAAAGVAALAVLTSVIVIGARSSSPASAPPVTSAAPTTAPSAQSAQETGTVAVNHPGRATIAVGTTADAETGFELALGWSITGERLIVTTYGSSSCPQRITTITLTAPQVLSLGTSADNPASGTRACTDDASPYTSEIIVPEGIVRTEPLTVVLLGRTFEVPSIARVSTRTTGAPSTAEPTEDTAIDVATAYPGPAAAPVVEPTAMQFPGLSSEVAWNVPGDRLLITTMGGGNCPQRIVAVTRTAPQQITLEIPVVDATRVCTAELRPFTYELVMPVDISSSQPLTIVVNGQHEVVPPISSVQTGPVTRAFRSDDVGLGGPAPVTHGILDDYFEARWTANGRLLITTVGSSSPGCEESITSVTHTGPQEITIGTGGVVNGTPVPTTVMLSCHMDLSALTSEIVLPDGIVDTEPLTIVLDGMRLELPPLS